jgi:hypothetical protein
MKRNDGNMHDDQKEIFVWIPLIGFDRDQEDKGVAEFLRKTITPPTAVSLFLFHSDIVNQHQGMDQEYPLPPDNCSYYGSVRNEDRYRQEWSNHDLRELCRNLKANGVQPYLGIMGVYLHNRHHYEWESDYPELMYIYKNGRTSGLNVLKRFNNGRYYEDFFTDRINNVSDVFCPPSLSISEGDFSADIIDQFVQHSGCTLPASIIQNLESNAQAHVEERGDYIWNNFRLELITFYRWRWEGFFKKLSDELHRDDKELIVNNAWCSEPFEAIYRFGIDYKALFRAGVDYMVPETVPVGQHMTTQTMSDNADEPFRYYQYMTMAMFMSAYTPQGKLLCLNGVKDVTEEWDTLHHMSTLLERDIYTLSGYYLKTDQGVRRCIQGMFVCLGDGIRRDEWGWLNSRYEVGFGDTPSGCSAPTLIWSDASLENLLPDYMRSKRWTMHKIVYELAKACAPTGFTARIEDLAHVGGPIFVPNADLYSEEEQLALAAYDRGPVIGVAKAGYRLPGGKEPAISFEDRHAAYPLCAFAYNMEVINAEKLTSQLGDTSGEEEIQGDPYLARDPAYFRSDLRYRKVSQGFINSCAALLRAADNSRIEAPAGVPVLSYTFDSDDRVRVVVINDDRLRYIKPVIVSEEAIHYVSPVSRYPVLPPQLVNQAQDALHYGFIAKVPPAGLSIFDVTFER